MFLAAITIYDAEGNSDHQLPSYQVGYSLLPAVINFGSLLVAFALCLVLGCRPYDSDIPLVGTCSAAISAAYHKTPNDLEPHIQPVRWGVVEVNDATGVGHCCLTTLEVAAPVEGSEYAGLKEE